ncbi:MAG: quinone-dependent dihydroorotate dehydrogenase [Bacteroidetes bacterium]|nr:quinone-dependent dihydroorotate dehydrogenase [Bacteroidota bacterium]MDA0902857.1 quinone-dependent dihydroorotate dehydrogenase [Bacteroidota bacterium]MDA1241990.1 quinone-dependent dihydroorotate dehydrogenase [Bacteroidota bacterium]
MYQNVLKPLFFLMSPERAHYLAMDLLVMASRVPGVRWWMKRRSAQRNVGQEVTVAGLTFPNRVGLAAGFDKDARWLDALAMLGFGFVEIGTLTPRAQAGNPHPRLFRLIEDRGILNRMGFNNEGLVAAAGRLVRRPMGLVVGGNIGKNKITANDKAVEDYLACVDGLHAHVDYFVVNVSSPNTPGLRELQDKEPLSRLLRAVVARNRMHPGKRPVFLKIAPDLTDGQLDDIVDIVLAEEVDGVVATNTTVSREGLATSAEQVADMGPGGVSGVPVRARSTEVVRYLALKSGGRFPIVGVGGVDSPESAREKLDAGASLVQIYSGMIYEGPGLAARLVNGLKSL